MRASALVEAAGLEPVDPMRRDFRGGTVTHSLHARLEDAVDSL